MAICMLTILGYVQHNLGLSSSSGFGDLDLNYRRNTVE